MSGANFLELRHGEVRGTRLFSARSNGNIKCIVLLGKEDKKMYWYNPTTRTSERVEAPSTDEQAIQMLAGTEESAGLIKHYLELRRSGTPIEQALVLVGHEFRLRQPEYQLALRQEIYFGAVEKH
jgi:hypothetical protein